LLSLEAGKFTNTLRGLGMFQAFGENEDDNGLYRIGILISDGVFEAPQNFKKPDKC